MAPAPARPGRHLSRGDPAILVSLANAFGASGHRVTNTHELTTVLRLALAEPGVSLVDCPIDYAINDLLDTDLLQEAMDALQRQ